MNFLSSSSYQVKLVNIRNDDIADGNPKLTLGLIWTIILHFQVTYGNCITLPILQTVLIYHYSFLFILYLSRMCRVEFQPLFLKWALTRMAAYKKFDVKYDSMTEYPWIRTRMQKHTRAKRESGRKCSGIFGGGQGTNVNQNNIFQ